MTIYVEGVPIIRDTKAAAQLSDYVPEEERRMRQFRMSEQWRDGQRVDWRDVDRSSGND